MKRDFDLYHGAAGDSILGIITEGSMRPDAEHKIYFSERWEDALQHGADMKRKVTLAFKARVIIPSGASLSRVSTHGNPLAVIVTTTMPLPTKLAELYVRLPREHEVQIIKGTEAIKSYLLRDAP